MLTLFVCCFFKFIATKEPNSEKFWAYYVFSEQSFRENMPIISTVGSFVAMNLKKQQTNKVSIYESLS